MLDLVARQMLRTRNGLAYLAGTSQPRVAQTPRDLVWQLDKGRLWRYRSDRRRHSPAARLRTDGHVDRADQQLAPALAEGDRH